MNLSLGDFNLQVISGGRLRLDGGNMFGVVPRVLWEKKSPPDDKNRIQMDTNCLLVQTGEANVLIDTGYGPKCTPREREIFALQDGNPLVEHLADAGLAPENIDYVIPTHLHFDHAGGCTLKNGAGGLTPTFPNARYVVQKIEWDDASGRLPELAGAYFERDFLPIREANQLQLVDGAAEIIPGIRVRPAPGHTRGHQVVIIESRGQCAVYLGDVCPTRAHLRTFWTMAYDQFPLETRRTKPKLLGEIADKQWLAVFDHDPQVKAVYLRRDIKEEFTVRDIVAL